ncbi:MAG: hypothetical protein JO147_12520 [Actinobacteria bacterium]|nr:hypothetical protein [Actinomycetota bacterium]
MTRADAGIQRIEITELMPLVRRVAKLDQHGLIRLRAVGRLRSALALLPFGVLAGRAVTFDDRPDEGDADVVHSAADLAAWYDDPVAPEPPRQDLEWRSALPPAGGWQRVESVPDAVIRDLVRSGASTLKETAERENLPGAEPRAEVADALLGSVVLTVSNGPTSATVTLRLLSALTRMGFVARDTTVAVDVRGRWLRVAAAYGSVYAEQVGFGLGGLSPVGRR